MESFTSLMADMISFACYSMFYQQEKTHLYYFLVLLFLLGLMAVLKFVLLRRFGDVDFGHVGLVFGELQRKKPGLTVGGFDSKRRRFLAQFDPALYAPPNAENAAR